PVDEVVVEIIPDELEHHVQRSRAAGASVNVAVYFEEIGIDVGFWKGFRKAGEVLPMNRTALAGEKAGLRQDVRPRAQAADGDIAVIFLAKPGKHRLLAIVLDVQSRTDDHHRWAILTAHFAAFFLKRRVDGAFNAI